MRNTKIHERYCENFQQRSFKTTPTKNHKFESVIKSNPVKFKLSLPNKNKNDSSDEDLEKQKDLNLEKADLILQESIVLFDAIHTG